MRLHPLSRIIILLVVYSLFSPMTAWTTQSYVGLQYNPDYSYGIPLFKDRPKVGMSLNGINYPLFELEPRSMKWSAKIDSTGEHVDITKNFQDQVFHLPTRYSLNTYFELARSHYFDLQWQKYKVDHITGVGLASKREKGGINIDIPVKIKSKAFQTIFGGDRVGLTVNGNITINGGFRHEKRSEVRTAINRGSDYNFKMEQTQQFRVTGNVGDKVKVSVDQDSERPFDFENTIKLNYDGYEDEIVKKIEAGNISLSLPATRFVSFSGKNSGLFGIKSEMTMGNLNMTVIASQEKGENKKLTYSGGAQEGTQTIKDINYMKGIYFFLENVYRDAYFPLQNGIHAYNPNRVIADIEVYLSTSEQDPKRIWGFASADSATINENDFQITQEHVEGYWARLEKTDYFIATDLGYLRLNNYIGDDKMLAIAYRDTSGNVYGEINFNAQVDSVIHLKLIKPKNPRPTDLTWDLMFRHIYYLGSKNIDVEGFEAKIYYDPPSGDDEETIQTEAGVKSFLSIFGLDEVDEVGSLTPDNKIDNNANVLRLGMGELEFPSLRPFADPENPFLPADKYVRAMYDTTNQNEITRDSKFYFEIKSKSRSATISLGWNVIEGSEEVRLNGKPLTKGSDYIIDYYSGTLTVLDEQATSPSADLEVNYQRNELFQVEKKTLLGIRAEYNLWENSFIGGTFLYLNQRTLDQKVRPDKGPSRNIIWDLNTALTFKPNFLTKVIDALPLIQTKQPSSLKFEGEIAQILPNPNTLNNNETGDDDGVAYIDDFEASKRITPLGVIQGGWTPGSSPQQKDAALMGRLFWYNNFNMTAIQEIWPNREINPNTPNRVHVLSMVFEPKEDGNAPQDSWGGIMRALSTGYADQSDSKFIEIWVNGDVGTMHIDLGQITEDVIPNKKLDTEDLEVNGIRNGLLDEGEDLGLDGMAGIDPADFWDINGNGTQDPGEPTSWDDWELNQGAGFYEKSNGTEGNENNVNGRIPDTEDINRNGSLDQVNNYFQYTFSLNKSNPDTIYIAGDNKIDDGEYRPSWYLYRIPIAEPDSIIGQPDLTRLEYARIWIEDFPRGQAVVRIAEINLVGNDWKEKGIAFSDSSDYVSDDDTTIVATVINTHDNPEYKTPPGVSGVRDRITRVEAKEQSLVIQINNMPPESNGILQKTFFQAEDYIHYKKMKMFIHGGDAFGTNFFPVEKDTSQIEVFLRFGANEINFYEVRQPVYAGWEGNDLEVDLTELTQLKFLVADSATSTRIKRFSNGHIWKIVGDPSLTNVKQLIIGVKNTSKIHYFTGQVWVNELRLSNVQKDKGYAMRARVDLQVADVFSINSEINREDADFHNINQRFGSGDNNFGNTIGASLQLNKFLPRSWGFSIPISFNYKTSESSPKYLPGSDILVTSSTPDSVMELIKRSNESIGYGISFRKTTKSNNFFVKNTLDNLSLSYNAAESYSSDSKLKESNRKTYAANISYDLNFDPKANFSPFGWLTAIPVLKKLAEIKFYYLPTGLNLKASGNQSKTYSLTRTGLENKSQPFVITRSAQTGYKPLTSLSFDFSRTHKSDLTQAANPKELLLKGKFGQLTDVDQSAGLKFNPKLFSWLTTNMSYTAGYKWTNNLQLQNTGTGRSAANNSSLTGSFTFDPGKLVASFMGPSKSGAAARGKKPPVKQETPPPKEGEVKKKDAGPGMFKQILRGVGGFTKSFQPISVNYTQRKNINVSGLEEGTPSFRFMLGLDDSTGLNTVENVGTNRFQGRNSENLSFQTGVKIRNNIDITLRYSLDKSKNETTQITGDLSESAFKLSKEQDPIPFPEWNVRWTGLEKLPFVSKFVQRMGFDHSYSGKNSSSWQNTTDNITKKSFSSNFRPLIGMNITWKKNITTNIKYNQNVTFDETVRGGSGGSRSYNSDFSIQGSYSRSGGFRIPIPIWPFKNKEFKNNIDVSVTFDMGSNVTEQNVQGGKWEEMNKTSKWSFKPQLTYRFSNNVSGGMHFEYGKNESKRMGTTTFQDFGINVRIEIRGT